MNPQILIPGDLPLPAIVSPSRQRDWLRPRTTQIVRSKSSCRPRPVLCWTLLPRILGEKLSRLSGVCR